MLHEFVDAFLVASVSALPFTVYLMDARCVSEYEPFRLYDAVVTKRSAEPLSVITGVTISVLSSTGVV